MNRKIRWAAVALAAGCSLLWSWRDFDLTFSVRNVSTSQEYVDWKRSQSGVVKGEVVEQEWALDKHTVVEVDLKDRGLSKWKSLPEHIRLEFLREKLDHAANGFFMSINVAFQISATYEDVHDAALKALVGATCHALGNVVVTQVGSFTKRTAIFIDSDFDFLVQRPPECHQAGLNFTYTDKQKVAREIEKLECVEERVIIGNVSIKIQLRSAAVDLVLSNGRPEDFPNLRGGNNFHRNCGRINEFFEQTPAATFAVAGVKRASLYLWRSRPKGILLEAIVWRLAEDFPLPLTRNIRWWEFPHGGATKSLKLECFKFHQFVVSRLSDWENSSFGDDLKRDLGNLPNHKRDEYLAGLNIGDIQTVKLHRTMIDLFDYFFTDVRERARQEHTENDGPFELYFQKSLDKFFPFDF